MPHQRGQAANHEFDPDARENHPLPRGPAPKKQNVGGIREERRSEINQKKAHLMHIAAVVLAGKPMAELMDAAQSQQENPEYPNVVSALVRKIV